jgi:glycosyltransferase involved in cell wall biosynthesis
MPTRFTIITPTLNAAHLLEETLDSVLGQTALRRGVATLQYLVEDGGSKDGTLALLQKYERFGVEITSSPDRGTYDALARGLRRANGELVAYLNAGDYYHPTALDVVADAMSSGSLRWVTGLATFYTERSWVVFVRLPYAYRRSLFECGAYGTSLPHVQQESTFWRRELLAEIDLERLASFRLAGDYYLWLCFSRVEPLTILCAQLGGFKAHPNQLSSDLAGYQREVQAMVRPPSLMDRLAALRDRLLWVAPVSAKKRLNRNGIRSWDARSSRWV